MDPKPLDFLGSLLLLALFILLLYAGFLSYQSIDWSVLKRMEAEPFVLPTPLPSPIATSSATPSP